MRLPAGPDCRLVRLLAVVFGSAQENQVGAQGIKAWNHLDALAPDDEIVNVNGCDLHLLPLIKELFSPSLD